MTRIAWLTDIHLNFISYIDLVTFADQVLKQGPDSVVITGDIGEADSVVSYLTDLGEQLQKELYFVLGNHDYYKSSIYRVRDEVRVAARHSARLRWLPDIGIAELTPSVCLLGHGSWPDGRCGDWARSDLLLNDYFYIKEFNPSLRMSEYDSREFFDPGPTVADLFTSQSAKERRLATMQTLADEAARHFAGLLPKALAAYDHVVVATHVPPFRESTWYDGRISDDVWAPHFSCKAVGDVLRREMERHPAGRMTVLCGHTHGRGEAQILENLTVYTGDATYGRPKVQRVFEFS